MKLEIRSYDSLQQRAKRPFDPRTTLISIGDPEAAPPALLHQPAHMLRLVFDDITPETAVNWLELPEESLEEETLLCALLEAFNTFLFTDKMARETAAFLKAHLPDTDVLICQCEFGQSRSAAIAAAVAEYISGKGRAVFEDPRYGPNPYVYGKMLAALRQQPVRPADE